MFDSALVSAAAGAATLGERVGAYARVENAACAARLSVMADMLAEAHAADGSAEREQWVIDNWSAVCALIGAVQQVTTGVASGLLFDAVALRERLPQVAELFAAGELAYRLVRAICQRTALVRDRDAIAAVDADLASEFASRGATAVEEAHRVIDALVVRHDPFGVHRTRRAARHVGVDVLVEDVTGIARLSGAALTLDAKAFDKRLTKLATSVCPRDPRTVDQRRAAALGALGFGWDRVPCLCEHPDCAAAATPAGGGVVIHVIARQESLDGGAASGPRTPDPAPEPPDSGDRHPEPPVEPESLGDDALDRGGQQARSQVDRSPAAETPRQPEPLAPQPDTPPPDLATQRRALVGEPDPLLPRPWWGYGMSGLVDALDSNSRECPAAPPALVLGGPVLPAELAAHTALHATIRPLVHPGNAPPEPGYRPSKKLADFVRARDVTCRAVGCTRPATEADIDHTIAWPQGPTCASNLKCLCREHHLMKTFWPGWSDSQLPDGTVIWTAPDGSSYTTHPGSRTLFPELCTPTAEFTPKGSRPVKHTAGLTMPRRDTTPAQARRQRIDYERQLNEQGIAKERALKAEARTKEHDDPAASDPPPF